MKKDVYKPIEHFMLVRSIKKNAILHFPGMSHKWIYFLKEGLVKIAVMNDEGKEVIKSLIKQGHFFGELPILMEAERSQDYAVAMEDSVVGFVDTNKIRELMEVDSDFRTEVCRQIGRRILKAEKRLLSITFKDAHTRIC